MKLSAAISGLVILCCSMMAMAQTSPSNETDLHRYGEAEPQFIEQLKLLPAASTLVICSSQAIPSGWVLVGITTNFQCGSSFNNAFIIKQPGSPETVCISSPIPAGYVITAQISNGQCGNQFANAFVIKVPAQTETVCIFSPIPPNYVMVSIFTNGQCGSSFNNAASIRRL